MSGLAVGGKEWIANAQFQKGSAFIAAAISLEKMATTEPQRYVVLHLTCQGIEVTMKGLLLMKDFDRFRPQEKKTNKMPSGFGHELLRLVATALAEFGQNPLRGRLKDQLAELEKSYVSHEFRYAGLKDIFHDPQSIEIDAVTRRLHVLHRLIRKTSARIRLHGEVA